MLCVVVVSCLLAMPAAVWGGSTSDPLILEYQVSRALSELFEDLALCRPLPRARPYAASIQSSLRDCSDLIAMELSAGTVDARMAPLAKICRSVPALSRLSRSTTLFFASLKGASPGDVDTKRRLVARHYKNVLRMLADVDRSLYKPPERERALKAGPVECLSLIADQGSDPALSLKKQTMLLGKAAVSPDQRNRLFDNSAAYGHAKGPVASPPTSSRRSELPTQGLGFLTDLSVHRRAVLLQFDDQLMTPEALTTILRHLNPRMEVIVLAKDRDRAADVVARAKLRNPRRVRIERSKNLHPWGRDYFFVRVVKRDATGEPVEIWILRPNNVPDWTPEGQGDRPPLQQALEAYYPARYRFLRIDLNLHGGEFVNDGETAFVSRYVMEENPFVPENRLRVLLKEMLGVRRIVFVPHLPGWNHIDLYVTPVSRRTVLVADTRAGARLLSRWLQTHFTSDTAAQNHLRSMCHDIRDTSNIKARRTPSGWSFPEMEKLAGPLDQIAVELSNPALGLRVQRIPSLLGQVLGAFTYNNVWQADGQAYVPSFGFDDLDRRVQEIYRGYGLDPVAVPATSMACQGGAIHCTVHELARELPGRPLAADPGRGPRVE